MVAGGSSRKPAIRDAREEHALPAPQKQNTGALRRILKKKM